MPMTLKFNPQAIELAIAQIGDRAVKGMSDKMRRVAINVRDLARDYAPHKTGLLEDEIQYMTVKQAGRNSYIVFIDFDASRRDGAGQLGDYAKIMEEELHPYGRQKGLRYYHLGPGSIAKAAGGKKVGGRFLARAVKEGTKNLMGELATEVKRITNSNRVIPMDYEFDTGADE